MYASKYRLVPNLNFVCFFFPARFCPVIGIKASDTFLTSLLLPLPLSLLPIPLLSSITLDCFRCYRITMSTTPPDSPDFSSLPLDDELAKARDEISRLAAQVQVLSVHISQQRPKEFTYQELITRIAILKDNLSLVKKEKDKFQTLSEDNERGWDTTLEEVWQLEAHLDQAEINNTILRDQIQSMENERNPPILDDAGWGRKRPKFDD